MPDAPLILCPLADLPLGSARGFDPMGAGEDQVIAVHDDSGVRVFRNLCPHEQRPLGLRRDAFLSSDGRALMCYAHGALFDKQTGLCFAGPCAGDYLPRVASAVTVRGELTIAAAALAEVPARRPPSLGPDAFSVRIAHVFYDTADVVAIRLVQAGGGPMPPFAAGAHVDVALAQGIVRSYSIVNAPAERDHYLIGIRSGDGPAGSAVRALCAGDALRVSRPVNTFRLVTDARHHVLIAGGIGITPLLSMAAHLTAAAESFELHVCARSRAACAFRNRIEQSAFRGNVRFYFSEDGPAARLNMASLIGAPVAGTHLYVCGPEAFRTAARTRSIEQGWDGGAFHQEAF